MLAQLQIVLPMVRKNYERVCEAIRQDTSVHVLIAIDMINDFVGSIRQEVRLQGTDNKVYLVSHAGGEAMNPD
eukprot:9733667-Karenia_brevis.AAC.1